MANIIYQCLIKGQPLVVGQFETEKVLLSVKAIVSSIGHAWSVMPAAIAGVTPSVL